MYFCTLRFIRPRVMRHIAEQLAPPVVKPQQQKKHNNYTNIQINSNLVTEHRDEKMRHICHRNCIIIWHSCSYDMHDTQYVHY